MQFFTNISFAPGERHYDSPDYLPASAAPAAEPKSMQAIWPDYFARRGAPDATSWHYRGHWRDCLNVWCAYYGFMLRHPRMAFWGLRQFFHTLVYRVFGETIGDRSELTLTVITPLLIVMTPPLALAAVCIASLPVCKKHMPPMFRPFTVAGWANYCIMLALVFTLHGCRQRRRRIHPALPMRHSSKLFWNQFFAAELPAHQSATHIYAVCRRGNLEGQLPPDDILIKPVAAGGGHRLRSLRWDTVRGIYINGDAERGAHEPAQFTPRELEQHLSGAGVDMLVERLERARTPLPVSTLRVLTLCADTQVELICAAFLPAPAGSVSTAYFDLDTYLVDYEKQSIGEPLSPHSDKRLQGLPIPELTGIIRTCLHLHARLSEHVQISWDIIPADRGPVFLEGNVFPPGCDYKLTLFKTPANFRYLRDRIVMAERGMP